MTAQIAVLAMLGVGLTLYALLGGADFGGGVWSLLAFGRAREKQRDLIATAIAPVWEANHVWLIFVITGLFASFPRAFETLSIALYVPFSIALAGIVFRGAAFAFRAHGDKGSEWQRVWTQVFGIASLVSPLALGAAAGAIAAGRIRVRGDVTVAGALSSWIAPLPVMTGLLALAVCGYLAATYLTVEAVAAHDAELEAAFRARALASGVVAGALAAGGLLTARATAPVLWHGMLHRGFAFVALSAGAGIATFGATWVRSYRAARIAAAIAVASILAGWGAAQWPLLVVPDLSVKGAAAPGPALRAVAVGLFAGGLLVGPSLLLLFRVFKSSKALAAGPVEEA